MPTPSRPPELLAPAGDWDALRAAVMNGADAVYFGLSAFNARARAANFTLDELPAVMAYLHGRNVRGFVAMNILVFDGELAEAERFVRAVADAGVDAVIVQDLGLVTLVREVAPTLAVHGSTQMTLTEPRGIAFVRGLGVERVVLARELSLADIRLVAAKTDTPVEVFVHGALCVAYSGQCLTSEALGGRSANRGQCAQACRLPYEMVVDGVVKPLGDRAYLLSPQDLAAYDLMADLVDAGVISFKIEGRLKGGPYVAATTATYRAALDAALESRDYDLPRRGQLELAQTFSRGLTHGFLDGVNHQALVRGRVPKSRGVRLGRVTRVTPRGVTVELAESLPDLVKPGDGLLFDLGKPAEQEPGGRVWEVLPAGPGAVEVRFAAGAVTGVPVGCEVWKTDDPALTKRLEQTYAQDRPHRRTPVTAHLAGHLGGPLTLTLTGDDGRVGTATWPGPLEAARRRGTSADEIRGPLSRLGDTPFELADVTLDLPETAMVPKSIANELRRTAAAELSARRVARHATLPATARPTPVNAPADPADCRLTVLVRNMAQLDAVMAWKPDASPTPDFVVADFEDLRRYPEAVAKGRAAGVTVAVAPLRVWKPTEDGFTALVVRANPDAVLVRNLAGIAYFREQLPAATLVGDFSLNVANHRTARVLLDAGLTRLTPSYDLNWDQFQALLRASDASKFEPVVHQHMPMFHMEHCVFAAFLSTGKDHRDCGRPCESHAVELRDRTGAAFPVHPDTGCRNTVFNSVAQSGAEYVGRMRALGVRRFRIDLLRETPAEVVKLLEHYTRVMRGEVTGAATWRPLQALNQLGVTRGTLQLA
jgi:putative protease